MNFLLEQQVKIGRIISQLIWIILPLVSLSFILQACDENKFPVNPVPDQFEFIPPSDVNMLTAKGGDGQVTLTWDAAVENTLKAVHVTNKNTGEEKVLPGTASEITFTGLTNYEKYTFQVKTESLKEQLSYGVTINAKPFAHDNVKPGKVINLVGYKLGESIAFAVWESPEDIDIEKFVVTLGNESVTVDGESTFATINGNINMPLKVCAVDYSGNTSDATETMADAAVVTIDGFDNGETETVLIHKDPIISAIDGYVITYLNQEYKSSTSPLPEVYTQTMPVDNDQKLWLDDAKTKGSWLEPVKVTLLSKGKEISTYEYLTYNNIPGTLMLTHATVLNEEGVNVKRNNDGKSFNSNLGNFENKGSLPIYGLYDVNVYEDGDYETVMWFSANGTKTYTITIDDGPGIEGRTAEGSSGWDNYIEAPGPVLSLTKGKHQMKVEFPSGGHNFKKLVFRKIEK